MVYHHRNKVKKRRTLLLLTLLCVLLPFTPLAPASCHSGDSIVAVYGTTPTIDGVFSPGEWDDANFIPIGPAIAHVKQDGEYLNIAFLIFDNSYSGADYCVLGFDVDHNGINSVGDFYIMYERINYCSEYYGPSWTPVTPSGYSYSRTTYADHWIAEFRISYSKIGVTAGNAKTLGLCLGAADTLVGNYRWPPAANELFTGTYGDLTSDSYFWIPEIPSTIIATATMLAALLGISVHRKRYPRAKTEDITL